ncbi:MAG: hypothetical protein FJ272_16825 [Planctomycetes bacterium]|nr:hypothetical protein [Planctomycetota bacterium]
MPKRRLRMARLVRLKDADRSFDLEFWQRAGAQARFEAAWEMVSEVAAMRGKNARQPRLRRIVRQVERPPL